jgi:hypothetical protein
MYTFIFTWILTMFEIVQIWNIKHEGKDRIRILKKKTHHHDSCFIVDQRCENPHFYFCFRLWEKVKIFTYVPNAEVIFAHTITRLHEATLYLALCKNCMYIQCCRTCLEVVYLPEIELSGNRPIRNKTNRCYVLY